MYGKYFYRRVKSMMCDYSFLFRRISNGIRLMLLINPVYRKETSEIFIRLGGSKLCGIPLNGQEFAGGKQPFN